MELMVSPCFQPENSEKEKKQNCSSAAKVLIDEVYSCYDRRLGKRMILKASVLRLLIILL